MNRRAFLALFGVAASAAVVSPLVAALPPPTSPAAVEVGRWEGPRIVETEAIQIGDVFQVDLRDLAGALTGTRTVAILIAGHEDVEVFHLTGADKSDPLGEKACVGWKALNPRVGWRERWVSTRAGEGAQA